MLRLCYQILGLQNIGVTIVTFLYSTVTLLVNVAFPVLSGFNFRQIKVSLDRLDFLEPYYCRLQTTYLL